MSIKRIMRVVLATVIILAAMTAVAIGVVAWMELWFDRLPPPLAFIVSTSPVALVFAWVVVSVIDDVTRRASDD